MTCITAGHLRESLTLFAPAAEGVSLYLLKAIDETVDTLHSVERLASATSETAVQIHKSMSDWPIEVSAYLDPDDAAINAFEAGYRALEEYLPKLVLRKAAIDGDSLLDGNQADLLHTAYDRCIESIASLVESMKNLRAAVITHDLAVEPRPSEIFESTSDLIRSLR